MKQNTDAMNHFLHDNVDVLHDLFLKVWCAAYAMCGLTAMAGHRAPRRCCSKSCVSDTCRR